jgi:7-cyano-7-deazaguanine reductase
MTIEERRSLLTTKPNPDPRHDYVITMEGTFRRGAAARPDSTVLRYVPDRYIVDPKAFSDYLKSLENGEWSSLEHAAVTILEDLNNELVARWTQLFVSDGTNDSDAVTTHEVVLEDRQPHWDNPNLIGRLKRI